MLVDLGPDFQNEIINTDHIVRVRVEELGQADERYIDEIQIVLVTNGGPRWARYNHPPRFGVDVLADLKRRLHVQPADWINQYSVEMLRPLHSGRDGARGSLPSQIDRSTSAESKEAQS